MTNHAMKLAVPFLIWILVGFTSALPYEEEIKEWHRKRIESLKKEDGWLNLAGLYWLEEGENTFGSDTKNAIVFPADRSEGFLGKLILQDGKVRLEANEGASIFAGDQPVKQLDLFH